MDIRMMLERTQAINMFWEREINKYLQLKPSAMVSKDEVVSADEALKAARSGVSSFDLGDLWKQWTTGYQELVRLASDTTKTQSREELLQMYGEGVKMFGITEPLQGKGEQ